MTKWIEGLTLKILGLSVQWVPALASTNVRKRKVRELCFLHNVSLHEVPSQKVF